MIVNCMLVHQFLFLLDPVQSQKKSVICGVHIAIILCIQFPFVPQRLFLPRTAGPIERPVFLLRLTHIRSQVVTP